MGTYKTNEKIYDVERAETRVNKNFTVNVKFKEKVYSGIAVNISKTGICIETIGLFPEEREEIEINFVGDNSIFDLFGEVRWEKLISQVEPDQVIYGMGVKLHSVPAEYLNFIDYQKFS